MTTKRAASSRPEIARSAERGCEEPDPPTTAAQRSSHNRTTAPVIRALRELDRADRAALELIYWRGLTQTEVARELDLPPAVIRRCVARGMHQLAEHLTTPD